MSWYTELRCRKILHSAIKWLKIRSKNSCWIKFWHRKKSSSVVVVYRRTVFWPIISQVLADSGLSEQGFDLLLLCSLHVWRTVRGSSWLGRALKTKMYDGLITSRKRIYLSYYLIIELNSRTDTSSKKFYSIRSQTKRLFNEEHDKIPFQREIWQNTFSTRNLTQEVWPSQMAASRGEMPCLSAELMFAPWNKVKINQVLWSWGNLEDTTHLWKKVLDDFKLAVVAGIVQGKTSVDRGIDICSLVLRRSWQRTRLPWCFD